MPLAQRQPEHDAGGQDDGPQRRRRIDGVRIRFHCACSGKRARPPGPGKRDGCALSRPGRSRACR
ncbi:Uncharacterised protein [Bordetella pertussis]|nr:Uncharacterised protein [Bordetella pertussis]